MCKSAMKIFIGLICLTFLTVFVSHVASVTAGATDEPPVTGIAGGEVRILDMSNWNEIVSSLESYSPFHLIRNGIESKGVFLNPIVNKSSINFDSYGFELEAMNNKLNFPTILGKEIEDAKYYLICNVIKPGNSDISKFLYHFVSVIKYRNDVFPIVTLIAGNRALNIDLNNQKMFIEKINTEDGFLNGWYFAFNAEDDWLTCLLRFLGLSDVTGLWNKVNSFCTLNSQTQTVVALAVGLTSCIGLSAGCPLAIAQLTVYLGCAAADIGSCMGGGGNAACTSSIPFNQSVSGTLDSGCGSTNRSGSFAKYYEFSLSTQTQVTINLTSSSFDAYLLLLDGNGNVITSDDDSGGNTNSRITRTLSSGTYKLEVTSYRSGETGSFGISIATSSTPSPTPVVTPTPTQTACTSSIGLNQRVSGTLDSGCGSTNRSGSFAKYYGFSLSTQTQVTINLTSSSFDAYLLLLDRNENIIASDDDSGGNTNSRITRTLSSGTYKLEVTSYSSRETGSFVISITNP